MELNNLQENLFNNFEIVYCTYDISATFNESSSYWD